MGLLGVTVPEEMGGLGLGYLEHTIAMEGESKGLNRIGPNSEMQSSVKPRRLSP